MLTINKVRYSTQCKLQPQSRHLEKGTPQIPLCLYQLPIINGS